MTYQHLDRDKAGPGQISSDMPCRTKAVRATGGKGGFAYTHPANKNAGTWAVLIVLVLLLAAALVIALIGWSLGSDADVSASGYIAMALGVVFSLAAGFGLMGLVFFSSRAGYDEPPVLLPPEDQDGD